VFLPNKIPENTQYSCSNINEIIFEKKNYYQKGLITIDTLKFLGKIFPNVK